MRKLVWAIIISLFIALIIAIACLYSPPFSAMLYHVGVNVVGATIVSYITAGLTGMLMWGTAGLATATVVIVGIGLAFSIFLLVLKHYLWDKPVMNAAKSKFGVGNQVSTKQMTMQREPAEPETKPLKKEEIAPQT